MKKTKAQILVTENQVMSIGFLCGKGWHHKMSCFFLPSFLFSIYFCGKVRGGVVFFILRKVLLV